MSTKLNKIAKIYQQASLPAAPTKNAGKSPAPDAKNKSDTPRKKVEIDKAETEKNAKKDAKASKKV